MEPSAFLAGDEHPDGAEVDRGRTGQVDRGVSALGEQMQLRLDRGPRLRIELPAQLDDHPAIGRIALDERDMGIGIRTRSGHDEYTTCTRPHAALDSQSRPQLAPTLGARHLT